MKREAKLDQQHQPHRSSRDTFLALLLIGLVGGGFFTFLNVITGGFFVFVLLVVLGMSGFGYLHYLAWGRSLAEKVADERKTVEVRADEDGRPMEGERDEG